MDIFEVSRAAVSARSSTRLRILARFFAAIAIPGYRCFEFLERFEVILEAFSVPFKFAETWRRASAHETAVTLPESRSAILRAISSFQSSSSSRIEEIVEVSPSFG